ncbi:FUSC family membrane protein [Orrella sp. 11846]|uniref:FUSC family protein n=1 Tax=Orrella sp. 11846 TaxID=3409913 RepID=UPI003B59C31C
MTESRLNRLQRFIYSHYFVSALRRAGGVLLAFIIVGFIADSATQGMMGALGAVCVALIDQPGPLGQRVTTMIGGTILTGLTVAVTGYANPYHFILYAAVVAQAFFFSMLSVFGKRGAIVGTACLVLTVVTMHTPLSKDMVLTHTFVTVGGALFYIIFSIIVSRFLLLREQEQSLSVALLSTASYLKARAHMYEPGVDIDAGYRDLHLAQAAISDQYQAARDMIMPHLSAQALENKPRRKMVWNTFIDMTNIMEVMTATHTDYTQLHKELGDADIILFMRDALYKMANEMERVAEAITRERPINRRNSVKAELLAIEYELDRMKQQDFNTEHPEVYVICLLVLRRLRKANRLVEHMILQTHQDPQEATLNVQQLDSPLTEFLSRQSFRPGLLTSNLKMSSPTFRFSLRVTLAVAISLAIGLLVPALGARGYWIIITVIVIMKPAFILTKQRNTARLVGTLGGCVIAFATIILVRDQLTLQAMLVLSLIIGFSLVIVNYMLATIFNTAALLIALHLLLPSSYDFVEARAIDTLIGSIIAFVCSYFLPWWESKSLPGLARAAEAANKAYLKAGLSLLENQRDGKTQGLLASLTLPLAQRDTLVAFSNFAQSFYRMLGEPTAHQSHVSEFHNLLIQNHIMAAQISTLITQGKKLAPEELDPLIQALCMLDKALDQDDLTQASEKLIDPSRVTGPINWGFQLNQLQRAVQNVIRESNAVQPPAIAATATAST